MTNPLIIVRKPEEINIEPVEGHQLADLELATRAVNLLAKNYPGYHWRVWLHDDEFGGVMYVINMDVCAALFSNNLYGYVLKLSRVYGDPSLRCVLMAGGEILERARLIRGRSNGAEPTHVDGIKPGQQPIKGVTIFS